MFSVLDAIRRDSWRRLIGEEQDRTTRYVGHVCGDICAGERDQGGPVNLGRPVDQTPALPVRCRACGRWVQVGIGHRCNPRAKADRAFAPALAAWQRDGGVRL